MIARDRFRGEQLVAPELIDLEVVSTLRRAARAKRLDEQRLPPGAYRPRRTAAAASAAPPLLGRARELRDNLSAYDASYVTLAEAFHTVLLTADGRIERASGINREIAVLG